MFEQWKIVIVGAGTRGLSIAQVFAMKGLKTTLVDRSRHQLEKAEQIIAQNIETLRFAGEVTEEEAGEALKRIAYTDRIAPAASGANLILETVAEDPEMKRSLFAQLNELCPAETILASNTSDLNIFEIAEVSHPGRLVIAHWCAPSHIVPLVEIVRGPQTSDGTVETMKALLLRMGKKPSLVNQYVPGFILNRIDQALFREACYIVARGWADPEDVDAALKATYGARWAFEGPLELRDHIGWDVSLKVGSFVIPHLCKSTEPEGPAVDYCSKGWLGVKTGRGLKEYRDMDETQAQKERSLKILKIIKAVRELETEG